MRAQVGRAIGTAVVCLLPLAGPADGGDDPAAFEAAIRLLTRGVSPQRDSAHLTILNSLRQLHDPTLAALFRQLLQSDDWQMQVHAMLGLAEIGPDGHLDPWLVKQLDPRGQDHLLTQALDEDLLGPEQMRRILDWEGLRALPRILLLAELVARDEPVLPEELEPLASDTDLRVAGLAACLLAELGDAASLDRLRERLRLLGDRGRDTVLAWLIEAARQYELRAALPLVEDALRLDDARRELVYTALLTLLQLEPETGLARWSATWEQTPSAGRRVRLALILLASGDDVPAELYGRLPRDNRLLAALADVGVALSTGADPTGPLIALLDLGHPRSAAWVLEHLESMPDDRAALVYAHILDRLVAEPQEPLGPSLAVQAAARLYDAAPAMLLERLERMEDDSTAQEIVLLGLFEARAPGVGDAAARVDRDGPRRADSMALILVAKHAEHLAEEDLEQLGLVAAGGGRVSDGLQSQAAWLYLKHTGQVDMALGRLFAGS